MLASEKIALAAHLHVLLRRKTGRVTDTEWMVENADYARAIVRFARQKAQEDNHPDLADYAARLEAAVLGGLRPAPTTAAAPALPAAAASRDAGSALQRLRERHRAAGAAAAGEGEPADAATPRYIGGIR